MYINKSFSIITIVYNDVSHIKETIESVINQSYKNIEYILIDGGSNDGTKEKIMELISSCATTTLEKQEEGKIYLEAIHNTYPTLTFKFLSEKDKGIYDAMNKGIALTSREWINFMNCGDRFYDLEVLQKVANENIEQYDVVYGDTKVVKGKKEKIIVSPCNFKNRMCFCHQSSFTKREILISTKFDTSFKICADNDFFMKIYHQKHDFKKLNIIVSQYSLDGISSSPSWQFLYEDCKISFRYNKFFSFYLALRYLLITTPKYLLKKILEKAVKLC